MAETPEPESEQQAPHFVEITNEYDPSLSFAVLFPVGEEQGAKQSSCAYYIIEPGKHSGLHVDNAEEIAFVMEGVGEVFTGGYTHPLEPAKFFVFSAGVEHDIYAKGGVALRILSFFPTSEIKSAYQIPLIPIGGPVLSSKPPRVHVSSIDPDNLPENFPFTREEILGIEGSESEPEAKDAEGEEEAAG